MITFVFVTACSGYYVENELQEHKNGARKTIKIVSQGSKQEMKMGGLKDEYGW